MIKPNLLAGILSGISLSFFLAGCNAVMMKNSYSNYYSRLSPESYPSEISRLAVMTDEESSAYRPVAHLYLSLLYSSYKNPQKDYAKALRELKKYVLLHPGAARDYEIQNLMTLLKEINRAREERFEEIKLGKVKLKNKNEALAAENKTLDEFVENQKNELLEKEEKIRELEETIDKLKNLDMELEKKRKSLR